MQIHTLMSIHLNTYLRIHENIVFHDYISYYEQLQYYLPCMDIQKRTSQGYIDLIHVHVVKRKPEVSTGASRTWFLWSMARS